MYVCMYVIIIIIIIIINYTCIYIYIHVPIHSQIIHNRAVKSPSKVDTEPVRRLLSPVKM